MQPEKAEEIQAWLKKASVDLRAAGVDLAADPPLVGDALFHCQQAVEKALKAFLTAHDAPFRKTHDLDELAIACGRINPELEREVNPALELTTFAWAFRYPGESEEPSREEAEAALALAKQVYEAVLARLPAQGHPKSVPS
jgi:HEPN domain-containing protein